MNNIMGDNHLLGIIVCTTRHHPPFAERPYYEQLARVGKNIGITVVVFSPKQIDWSLRQVRGYIYNPDMRKWSLHKVSLPAVIYDRCFYLSPAHYRSYQPFVHRLRQDKHIELLGVPLKGKWQLAQLIAHSPLTRYFPRTERYEKPQDALAFLKKYNTLVAKPSGGSHGRGVVAIFRKTENGPCTVIGRGKGNEPLSHKFADTKQALAWLHQFIGESRYILQPYLQLRTPNHLPFDIRVLMQKDGRQTWQMTGMAVRTGTPYSLTSNLHGGGKAEKITPFLERLSFDQQTTERIETDIRTLCEQLPLLIERQHGRLCELGIDIGIDLQARVWLLEVNSKPGRQVFRQAGERQIYLTAIRRPIMYAHSLLQGRTAVNAKRRQR